MMENILLYSNYFLSLPFISFVGVLVIVKSYIKIRSYFRVTVNCWFCNENAKVPYEEYNCFVCSHCEQYNGFTEDGDYNREIYSQFMNHDQSSKFSHNQSALSSPTSNGLCEKCNQNQLTKVKTLAAFEPVNEKSFTSELRKYRESLEEQYRLCSKCEGNLSKVLAEKKKMVLGLKLARKEKNDRITLNSFTKVIDSSASKTLLLRKVCSVLLVVMAAFNWVDVISNIKINKQMLNESYSPTVASYIFIIISHLAAFTKVILQYCQSALHIKIVEKIYLFVKTIIIMISYTIGVNYHQYFATLNSTLFTIIPFGSMFLAFGGNVIDGFKISKWTCLLTLWSIYTTISGIEDFTGQYSVYKVLTAFIILILSLPIFKKRDQFHHILNNTANSFHHIPSEDYLSDECSEKSSISSNSQSFCSTANISAASDTALYKIRREKSPKLFNQKNFYNNMTSSTLHLNTPPGSAFKSYSTASIRSNNIHSPLAHRAHRGKNFNNFDEDRLSQRTLFKSVNNFGSERSLLSPSHFKQFTIATSYNNISLQPEMEKPKNYFLNNIACKENLSRGSSQSSGFESYASSVNYGDKMFSREDSLSKDVDNFSLYPESYSRSEQHYPIFNNNFLQNVRPQHFSGNNVINRGFKPEYLTELNERWNSNYNPFDLNSMNTFLPPVHKRYNLLRNAKYKNEEDIL